MEFPEDPRGDSRWDAHSAQAHHGRAHDGRAQDGRAPDGETEAWLRSELAFLHGVERRILRRSRLRKEAWRAAAVALIMAVFACCWYLAALSSDNSSSTACPAKATTASAAGHSAAEAKSAAIPGVTGHAHEGASADATASGCSG